MSNLVFLILFVIAFEQWLIVNGVTEIAEPYFWLLLVAVLFATVMDVVRLMKD